MAKAPPRQFSSILDKSSKDVDRTIKVPPVGTYLFVVQGLPRIDKSAKKKTEYSEYTLKFMEATDDVNEEDLDKYLTSSNGDKARLVDKTIKVKFYHTEDALGRLVSFLDHLDGLDKEAALEVDESIRQRMSEVAGKQVFGHIRHTASDDGERVYAEVNSTAPVTE